MAGTDYAAATDHVARADPLLPSRIDRAVIAVVRVGVGLLWLHNVGWKTPPDFGQGEPPTGLYQPSSSACWPAVVPAFSAVTHRPFHCGWDWVSGSSQSAWCPDLRRLTKYP